jgi:hypothetical protein
MKLTKKQLATYNNHIGNLFNEYALDNIEVDENLNLTQGGITVFLFDILDAETQALIINDCELEFITDLTPFTKIGETREYPDFWDFKTENEIKAHFVCNGRLLKTKYGEQKTFIFAKLNNFGAIEKFYTVQSLPALKMFFDEPENTQSIYKIKYLGKQENREKTATYNHFSVLKKENKNNLDINLSIFK